MATSLFHDWRFTLGGCKHLIRRIAGHLGAHTHTVRRPVSAKNEGHTLGEFEFQNSK